MFGALSSGSSARMRVADMGVIGMPFGNCRPAFQFYHEGLGFPSFVQTDPRQIKVCSRLLGCRAAGRDTGFHACPAPILLSSHLTAEKVTLK